MKILIVDDEHLARERLQRLLAGIEGIDTISESDNGRNALARIENDHPDLILLDIRMPTLDGMALAQKVHSLKSPPWIIFTTAYSEHAIDAYGVEAVDYLLKPIRKERLVEAINKVRLRITRPAGAPMLRTTESGRVRLVSLDEILYFQAESKCVTACLSRHNLLLEDSLKQLQSRLGDAVIRVHRNALVPQQQVSGIIRADDGEQHIQLKDGRVGPAISRRHLPKVRKLLKARAQ